MNENKNKVSTLVALNNYTPLESGVFACRGGEEEGVSYSDGEVEEKYIYSVLSSVEDLSSLSEELRSYERDWASECHLSSKRANVFRALDFTGVQHVLEVGSGCGAITRFLGEQGMVIDAVEGSLRRAEITRLRCRGIDNVTVIQADFNGMELPDSYYDLAILTGVLEYAGKFSAAGDNPMDAAVAMLDRIIACLRPGGTLLVAIENRIGYKYLAGASEDHFSRPWVGVSNYPDCDDPQYQIKQGIRTWDKSQWKQILDKLSGISTSWYYPFPDYKLATVLLSDDFIRSTPFAWTSLSRVRSRDYTAIWSSPVDEQLFWYTAATAKALEEMANSFVLVLQRQSRFSPVKSIVPFDFAHFSGHNRKPEYRVMVKKEKGEVQVEKKRMLPLIEPSHDAVVVQQLEPEPFYEGKLLSVFWGEVIRSCPSSVTFDGLLKQYYQYIVGECEVVSPSKLLDLLPFNIVMAEDGGWHFFDQEWQAKEEISPQFILFRALLYFYLENKDILLTFCKRENLRNGWDFVSYCLERLLYSSEFDLNRFVDIENSIQKSVNISERLSSIESVLDSTLVRTMDIWSWERTSLVWGENGEVTAPMSSSQSERCQCIVFKLPPESYASPYIQLSLGIPEQMIGSVFAINSFTLYECHPDGGRKRIFPGETDELLLPIMKLTGLTFFPDYAGGVFSVDEKEPQILHFLFTNQANVQALMALECEIVLELTGEDSTRISLDQSVREKQNLDVLMESKRREVLDLQNVLAEIEQSCGWRAVLKVRKIRDKIASFLSREVWVEVDKPQEGGKQKYHGSVTHAIHDISSHKKLAHPELISIVLGVCNTGVDELNRAVDSVFAQSYRNWELIIVDSSSTYGVTLQALANLKHPQIKIHYLKQSQNITQALDAGRQLAQGEWITFLGHLDRFHPDALLLFLRKVHELSSDAVYSDEEVFDRNGEVVDVKIKPEFSLDIIDGIDFIGASFFIRRSIVSQVGGLDPEFDGVQLFDLMLRATKHTDKIIHLKKAMYKVWQLEPPSQGKLEQIYNKSLRAWEKNMLL